MHTPSSKYLSHQPLILKGLSLNELCFVVFAGIASGALAGIFVGFLVGLKAILAIVGVLLGGLVGYFCLSRVLVRLKGSAPTNLLKKKAVMVLARFGIVKNPYDHYEGVWLKSRKIKG